MTAVPTGRVLPLRLAVAAGESLDGWVERLAARYDMSVRELLPWFGLRTQNLTAQVLLARLPAAALRRIERQAGLDTGRLDRAVFGAHTPPTWRPLTGSRFCPGCLTDNGIWPLAWRLPWTFACTTHRALLVDRCPGCGQRPRHGLHFPARASEPGSCTSRLSDGSCGTDLTAAPRWLLDVDDRRLRAQRWINQQLDGCLHTALTPSAIADLADLDAFGAWIRYRAQPAHFRHYGGPTLAAFDAYTARRYTTPKPRGVPMTDALLVAAVAVTAIELLTATTAADIVTLLDPLLRDSQIASTKDHTGGRGRRRSLPTGPYWMRTLTTARQTALLTAIDPMLTPLDRLRLRTCTPTPRLPGPGTASRIGLIPQTFWPAWVVRLTPPVKRFGDSLHTAAPCWLLLAGQPHRRTRDALAGLRRKWPTQAHYLLAGLPGPAQSATIAVICRIADYLDTHGSPIDYQRRRRLITTDLLTWPQWQQLCFDTMAHPGQQRRHLDARRYLYQLLTGADLTEPHADLTLQNAADRSIYLAFADTITTPLRQALHDRAREHLHHLGIAEPVTWAPPGSCADGLDLPGRDPDDIDLAAVHQRVLRNRQPVGVAADALDRSIDHVRYALHTAITRPAREWGPNAAPRAWHTQQRARALLTPEFFQREYVHGGKRLKTLHAETGLHRKMLADYAKAAGIDLAVAREPHHIDEAWLRDQYLHHRKSFPAIAADLGLSEMTVTRAARAYGIPARQPGITSHPHLIAAIDHTIPPDVRRAVDGQLHGWLRLRRFQQAMNHPSLTIAAQHIGAHVSALVTQIHRLERDIGTSLIQRATPTSPGTPTDRGTALLRDLQQPHVQELMNRYGTPISGWKPDDPRRHRSRRQPRAPQSPLAHDAPPDLHRALDGHRGAWARLQRLAAAMAFPTLTEAAAALAINPATLIEQLQRLEHDIGAALFHRATPASQTQYPTPRGAALLQAIADADPSPHSHPPPRPAYTTPAAATALPADLLRAVQGQRSGWIRLERFAVTMNHPTISAAATAIGIHRTTLIEQLRLETDIGEALYHRATGDGQTQQPTSRGTTLLAAFNRSDVQDLHIQRARLPRPPEHSADPAPPPITDSSQHGL